MKYRTRTFHTDKQKSEMWDRWQRGESMSSIGRHFNRASSSIFPHLVQFGGIRPPVRKRSRFTLSLSEREEISRGLVAKQSLRSIAKSLNRSPSTIKAVIRPAQYAATSTNGSFREGDLLNFAKLECPVSLGLARSEERVDFGSKVRRMRQYWS